MSERTGADAAPDHDDDGRVRDREARAGARRAMGRALLGVVAATTLVWVLVLLGWDEAPFTLTFDDAYYYLGIARNLVDGHGSTFDQVNLTNGYHPLWMGVATLPFLVGLDDLAAARALLVVSLLGWGVSLAVAGALVTDEVDGWSLGRKAASGDPDVARRLRRGATTVAALALALVALNPFVTKTVANGLETGISVPIFAAVLLLGVRRGGRWLGGGHAARWGTAVLLSLAFLARTDAVLLIGCLGLWCVAEVVTGRRGRLRAPDGRVIEGTAPRPDPPGVVALLEVFALPAVVIASYLALNLAVFGTPLQVSGLVKQARLGPVTLGAFALAALVAAALGWRGFRRLGRPAPTRAGRFPHAGSVAVRTAWFGAFCVLVVAYYLVLQSQFWLWYLGPVVLYLVVLFVLAVADITEASLRDRRAGDSPARSLLPVAAIVGVPLLVALVVTGRSFTDPTLRSIQLANRDAGEWIDAELPDDAVLASWDAGVVGFFSHRSVINIDGVVNSIEFRDALREGRVPEVLRCHAIGYVTNHGPAGGDPEIVALAAEVAGTDEAAVGAPIYDEVFAYSGTTTGSAGTDSSGLRYLGMYVYVVPPLAAADPAC